MTHAKGEFEVELTPEGSASAPDGVTLARLRLAKRFHGELEATSVGQMLSAVTPVDGSAGYVAIERVSGTLRGRVGTFVLQHFGMMTRGSPSLTVSVVSDSATGELAGLTGTMGIRIEEGVHRYDFEFRLPDRGP